MGDISAAIKNINDNYIAKIPRDKLTPWLKQYIEIKSGYPNTLLLFQMGDFYELFGEDAEIASKILGIALTRRSKDIDLPMAGIPIHAFSRYIKRLVEAGYHVAICDQLEEPDGKKLVRRGVVRVITPGTIYEEELLSEEKNNFIMAVALTFPIEVVWADLSTSEAYWFKGTKTEVERLINVVSPSELIIEKGLNLNTEKKSINWVPLSPLTNYPFARAWQILTEYLNTVYPQSCELISEPKYFSFTENVNLDDNTIRNLEIVDPLLKGGISLFSILSVMRTPMGKRLLRKRLLNPDKNVSSLQEKWNLIEKFVSDPENRISTLAALEKIGDIQRQFSKLKAQRHKLHPRHFLSFLDSLQTASTLTKHSNLAFICSELENKFKDDPSEVGKGIFKSGVFPELDKLYQLIENTEQYMINLESSLREKTGIKNLRIGYNRQLGYYIEVTKSQISKVPVEWDRKQTLKQAERYTTQELKSLELEILKASSSLEETEREFYSQLIDEILSYQEEIILIANEIAELDVAASFAEFACKNNYSKPIITTEDILRIENGRHPVVEQLTEFVPNNTELKDGEIHIITGPNMAGKSTYIRQVATIILMAQAGLWVPADKLIFKPVDGIFARIGAADNLARGKSTFMVEMSETAQILRSATKNSLIIFDEIGRGTSTYDGISIAWSIVEYVHNTIGAKTLFATHYHELSKLNLPRVNFYTTKVKETGAEIVFLYRIVEGVSNKSYGIYVAKLASIPDEILQRAEEILAWLESERKNQSLVVKNVLFGNIASSKVEEYLKSIELNKVTPIEALNILAEMKKMIE